MNAVPAISYQSPVESVVEFIRAIREIFPEGTTVERVGCWTWITFPAKPADDVRAVLKEHGFRWIPKREKWAHTGGKPSRHGKGDPRDRYDTESL